LIPVASPQVVPVRLAQVFAAFDAAGVRWSLLRAREALAHPEGDVDILVEPGQLSRVRALVLEQAFVPLALPGRDLHAVDLDGESGRFLWLHIQTEVHIGGITVPASDVLALASGHPVPQPADAWLLWLLLLRGLLEKGGVAERHRPTVARLARGHPGGPEVLEAIGTAFRLFR
jgi:hypothetical protein